MENKNNEVKITERASLERNLKPNEYTPEADKYEDTNGVLESIAVAMGEKMPVLLVGETGTGKTSIVRHLAKITNNGFRRVNCNGGTTPEDLVGRILINERGTYWIDGVLTDAMRKGYWILLDEINSASAEILFTIHSLLDDDGYIVLAENNGEVVRPHKNFRFFAAMNPSDKGEYSGVRDLNRALMSRFVVVRTDFPNPETETRILVERGGVGPEAAERMVEFAVQIRAMKQKEKSDFTLSTRDLIQWAKLFKKFDRFIPTAEMSLLNKTRSDDRRAIEDLLLLNFKKDDEGKDKDKAGESKTGKK